MIWVIANDLVVDGQVDASGAGGSNAPGGGGSIKLDVSSLSGAGPVFAKGGSTGTGWSSGGGGGRIAINYDTNSLSEESVSATGGTAWRNGAAGTIYLKDDAESTGRLIIDNEEVATDRVTPLNADRTDLRAFMTLESLGGARVEIDGVSISQLNVGDLTVDGAGSGIMTSGRDLDGLRLNVAGTMRISDGAFISVWADGLLGGGHSGNTFGDAGETFDIDGTVVVVGSTGGAGGSYGGSGGEDPPGAIANPSYDIPQNPRLVGSGGSRSEASGYGGRAGGRIWVNAPICTLEAGTTLWANGENATSGTGSQGGGSGGAIKLD